MRSSTSIGTFAGATGKSSRVIRAAPQLFFFFGRSRRAGTSRAGRPASRPHWGDEVVGTGTGISRSPAPGRQNRPPETTAGAALSTVPRRSHALLLAERQAAADSGLATVQLVDFDLGVTWDPNATEPWLVQREGAAVLVVRSDGNRDQDRRLVILEWIRCSGAVLSGPDVTRPGQASSPLEGRRSGLPVGRRSHQQQMGRRLEGSRTEFTLGTTRPDSRDSTFRLVPKGLHIRGPVPRLPGSP